MHAPLWLNRSDSPSPVIRMVVAATALLALVVPALLVHYAPPVHHPARRLARVQHVIPRAQLPPVEPVAFEDVGPDEARIINAKVPFTTDPVPAARPFRLADAPLDQARAVDCLAAGALYEAGDDAVGERAVAQVVLNRLRHPAFPKSVCGVVFQGAERSTGCQFTFSCDGAMQHHAWTAEAWARARQVALAALNGSVFAKVGYSTHYHTDWVVPYWSASLDKVSAVGTHLFFRWAGWWGTPGAFRRVIARDEPVVAQLAPYSLAHRADALLTDLLTPEQRLAAVNGAAAKLPPPVAGDPDSFLVTIDSGLQPEDLPRLAVQSCGARPYCKFMAWTSATPKRLPLSSGEIASMAFSYLRDHAHNFDKMLWNCRVFPRTQPQLCMKAQTFLPAPPSPAPPAAAAPKAETAPPADAASNITAP